MSWDTGWSKGTRRWGTWISPSEGEGGCNSPSGRKEILERDWSTGENQGILYKTGWGNLRNLFNFMWNLSESLSIF